MTNITADTITPPRGSRTDSNQEKSATRTRLARTSSGDESDGGARPRKPRRQRPNVRAGQVSGQLERGPVEALRLFTPFRSSTSFPILRTTAAQQAGGQVLIATSSFVTRASYLEGVDLR